MSKTESRRAETMKDDWCRHYRGFQHETCEAGCRMADVDRGDGTKLQPPCFTPERASRCPSHALYSDAEIEEMELAVIAALTSATKAKDAIVKHHGETGQCSGTIPCPTCGKDMRFSYATHNGHAHAICSTPDCTFFRE